MMAGSMQMHFITNRKTWESACGLLIEFPEFGTETLDEVTCGGCTRRLSELMGPNAARTSLPTAPSITERESIVPREHWLVDRLEDVARAIGEELIAGRAAPKAWFEECQWILEWLERENEGLSDD